MNRDKYVFGLFMDMTGAFDRVWWPGVLHRLHVKGISGEMYKVIKDYLKGGWVQLEEGNWVKGKRVNRGCPQGSVLGPQLWKIVFDELIEMMEGRHGKSIEMIAYADDRTNSRREIEEKANLVIKDLMEWCRMAKMELSKEKTVGMMLKGKLDSGRLPRVFLEERKICIVNEVKYLGILLTRNMGIEKHIQEIADKGRKKMGKYFGLIRKLKIPYKVTMIIYKGVYDSIMTYAVWAWYKIMRKAELRKVNSEQRKVLLAMIKGYRTVSMDATNVIAGVMPMDLEMRRRWLQG
ncbi:hypothetical protein J437_LFUL019162 [Ladona fulva]|uniref:Reverse transcriptase domain-containing protein n=1 Tax=Ladona fulva TaxID=123851 RepID=A0A8K0JU28_LADFU|nr:hypothetical protein J437_LFUL019162 [Ladona fulva]